MSDHGRGRGYRKRRRVIENDDHLIRRESFFEELHPLSATSARTQRLVVGSYTKPGLHWGASLGFLVVEVSDGARVHIAAAEDDFVEEKSMRIGGAGVLVYSIAARGRLEDGEPRGGTSLARGFATDRGDVFAHNGGLAADWPRRACTISRASHTYPSLHIITDPSPGRGTARGRSRRRPCRRRAARAPVRAAESGANHSSVTAPRTFAPKLTLRRRHTRASSARGRTEAPRARDSRDARRRARAQPGQRRHSTAVRHACAPRGGDSARRPRFVTCSGPPTKLTTRRFSGSSSILGWIVSVTRRGDRHTAGARPPR